MKLEAIDISFKYGKGSRQILDHVNLSVEPGEKVGIMAPSGYGKTTLCKILAGYERPDQGKVLVDGMPILKPETSTGNRSFHSSRIPRPSSIRARSPGSSNVQSPSARTVLRRLFGFTESSGCCQTICTGL